MNEKMKAVGEVLRSAIGKSDMRPTAAIIVAAGSSVRMGGNTPKQFLPLSGMPVVVWTLRAYEASDYIDEIVAVVRPGDREKYLEFKEQFSISKLTKIVDGGQTRQESVLRGVETLGDSVSYVAIADGARPLTTPDMIRKVCLAAYRFGGATAAYPAFDTIKVSDQHGFIVDTVERSTVWHATTPQVFALNVYRAAAYSSKDEGFEATDDNSLVENIGHQVKLVDCGRDNIKITTPDDIYLCETLIRRRAEKSRGAFDEKSTQRAEKIKMKTDNKKKRTFDEEDE
ncbi:MAG: 2-C-methyl-D-erythritol 4-phosphate cytidylyltransferase [Clostridia bacterium]|nr:2-C-methyl-D-erythritol 4-phosphate cytidylyltransferase [Clostridia bacterium]